MRLSRECRPGAWPARKWLPVVALLALAVGACGDGTPTAAPGEPPPAAACNPSDPATAAECGTLILGLTDADGDFLNYRVDVVSLTLEQADGSLVETLPMRTRIDFTEYTDLTEFVTAALVPPGVYVAGSITKSSSRRPGNRKSPSPWTPTGIRWPRQRSESSCRIAIGCRSCVVCLRC
jgi:hypothetical protein